MNVVDRETGEVVDLDRVQRLIAKHPDVTRERQREAILTQLLTYGVTLANIRRDLDKRLDVGMTMLNQTEDDAKQELWNGWLLEYELVTDVLSGIEEGVTLGRWGNVSTRRDA